ncbi:MAG: 1-deoxy-D-xylulose-5-phosphate reductoisomerase [Candidatus Aminicenantes bacterium]|nr:1-deoxy-D-xylulose-5-phosphate reductoisomerase [Candidatus Aminicenantes bacterium]
MTHVAVLGSTGSIGQNTLEIISHFKDRFKVVGLSAGKNTKRLSHQIKTYKPDIVSLREKKDADELKDMKWDHPMEITWGPEGAEKVAGFDKNDVIISAITGINGLRPTLAAVKTGKRLGLANKESMVAAGALINQESSRSGAEVIPVDSEHSGVFQLLHKENLREVNKVILTASGGPFFQLDPKELENQSVESALNHPRWSMGKKITIDSATLMNKGLELIEAKWLFHLPPEKLGVLIHPQSIVHSLVEMRDGSVLAQLSRTDMKIPIQLALTYPHRRESLLPSLDLSKVKALDFFEVDFKKFPLLEMALKALSREQSFSIALNASNEAAVHSFLKKDIRFSDIWEVVIEVVEETEERSVNNIEDILKIDQETRKRTWEKIRKRN